MTATERQKNIIKTLETKGGIFKINDIAKKYNVSNETARRDIEFLKEQGLLTRVFGGAILANNMGNTLINAKKNNRDLEKKNAIAKVAASLVKDGESIMVGQGSTMLQFVRNLKQHKDLTIITTNLQVAMELVMTKFKIIILGGLLDSDELDISGPITLNNLDFFHVDKAFLGAGGVTLESGLSDYNPIGFGRHSKMSQRADSTILVAQSDKFGKNALSIEMPFNQIDVIITDDGLPSTFVEAIKKENKKLILVQIDDTPSSEV